MEKGICKHEGYFFLGLLDMYTSWFPLNAIINMGTSRGLAGDNFMAPIIWSREETGRYPGRIPIHTTID